MVTFLLFCALGLLVYLAMYQLSRDLFNPFGIASVIWLVCAGVSSLRLSVFEDPWSLETYSAIVVSILPVIAIGLVVLSTRGRSNARKTKLEKARIQSNVYYNSFLLFLMLYCIACSLAEWRLNHFQIVLDADSFDAKSSYVSGGVVIHAGVTLLPYCGLLSVFNLLFVAQSRAMKCKDVILLLYTIGYFVIIQISRGSLLIVVLGALFLVTRKVQVKVRHFFPVLAVLVIAMVLLMRLRLNEGSIVYSYTSLSPEFNAIYSYISSCFNNLNLLVQHGPDYSVISNTIPLFNSSSTLVDDQSFYTAGVFNAMTWLRPYYIDLGLLGTVLYPAIVFLLVSVVYVKSRLKIEWLPIMAFLQKPIMMIFFSSYFTISGYNILWIACGIACVKLLHFRQDGAGSHFAIEAHE